jgi:exosortase
MQGAETSQEACVRERWDSPATAGLLWVFVLLLVVYAYVVYVMVREWATVEEMGHGFFVPVVSGYIVWQQRQQIQQIPMKTNWWGVLPIIGGFGLLICGTFGADFFLTRVGFLSTFIGTILTVCGTAMLRQIAFPLLLLLFMIRIPLFIYSQITFPLQLFASYVAEVILTALGIPVLREGNILELQSQRLSVVEACSGIRSLLSLSFLSLVYGYFFDRKPWMRWVLLVSSIPIAIGANAGRVAITGIVSEYRKDLVEGVYHTFEGWVIFMIAIVALIILHQIINAVYYRVYAQKKH